MDGERQKVSLKQQMAYADAVAYLEALLKSFREGRIVVERGGESVVLTPPRSVDVEIEARRKGDRQKFSLELEWSEAPAVAEAPLTISPDLPKGDAPCSGGCPTSAPISAPASTVGYGKAEPARQENPRPEVSKDASRDASRPGGK